jgi:hypothetical protein
VSAGATGGGEEESLRRRDRFARLQFLRTVLAHYGLTCDDDASSTSYRISNRKGAAVLVEHLGQLWTAAEALAGISLDPLDDCLIADLGADGASGG